MGRDGDDSLIGGNDTIGTGAGADVVSDFDLTLVNGLTRDQFDVSGPTDAGGNPVNAGQIDVADDGTGNAVLYFPGGEPLPCKVSAPTPSTRCRRCTRWVSPALPQAH